MKRLIIIDGNALVHRAYHALPQLKTKKGETVNAVYGFLTIFLKAAKELNPDYVCACFDLPGPTFRHEIFKEYKATRPKAPDELYEQIPKIKEALASLKIPVFAKKTYEADDVIAAIVKNPQLKKIESFILSGDLDALQLVDKTTKMYALRRGIKDVVVYGRQEVKKRYGVLPEQITDLKGLMGDPSDNIPGVPGIGQKTASRLLNKFGSLENLYQAIGEDKKANKEIKERIRDLLLKYRKQAFLSKRLATARKDISLKFNLEKCQWPKFEKEEVEKIFAKFEFKKLGERLFEQKQNSLF